MTEEQIARAEIRDTLDRYYHFVDEIDVSPLREVFSEDCIIDTTAFGGGVRRGIEDILAGFSSPAPRMVRAHMGTNMRIALESEDTATSTTKCIAMLGDGTVGVAIHDDRLRRTAEGWRIVARTIAMPVQLAAAAAK